MEMKSEWRESDLIGAVRFVARFIIIVLPSGANRALRSKWSGSGDIHWPSLGAPIGLIEP